MNKCDTRCAMIRPLSEAVQSHLRSGVAITSITQCTEELVMNALDAGATCIAIRVDLPCFKVQVVDNGQGMTREQLGQVGERYSTSKCHDLEDLNRLQYFGYRGEAIASIRDTAAILEINSRTTQSHQTYCRMFQRGSALPVSESAVQRPSVGTTVTVHDLFYSLPVRRKAVIEALELERVRYRVEGIALIHPAISFSLRNDVTGHVLLQTRKSSSMLTSFTHLFGQARAKSLREVSVQKDSFEVEGYIGKEGHCNKNLQFVFVNSRLVLKTKIHKILNHVLRRSLVLKKKVTGSETDPSKSQAGEALTLSPPKQGEKYAMFVLNVKCPLDVYDITFDPAKTLVEFKNWIALTNAIDEMVMSFLKKENLLSLSETPSLSSDPAGPVDSTPNKEGGGSSDPEDEGENEISMLCNLNQQAAVGVGSEVQNPASTDYTGNISTQNATNCLFSRTVRRPFGQGIQSEKNIEIFDENSLQIKNGSDICDSLAEGTVTQVVEETPMTVVDDSSHKSDNHSPETSKFPVNSAQFLAGKSGTSAEVTKTQSLCHDNCSSEILPSTVERHSFGSTMSETQSLSVSSTADEESEHYLTEVQDTNSSAAHAGESEDPFPSSLRDPLPRYESCPSAAHEKDRTGALEKQRKALICLPDSPSASSCLGVHRLQNLRLITNKPSHSSAAEIMSKRLRLTTTEHMQKSAAQKISERLGLKEKKVINEKLQKFKNTNVSSKQTNNDKCTVTFTPDDAVKTSDRDKLSVSSITSTSQLDSVVKKSLNDASENAISYDSASHEKAPDKKNIVTSENHQEQKEVQQDEQNSIRSMQSKLVGREDTNDKSTDRRTPIIPTIADIDFLTSRSEAAARKRFNPFELSTASKLSKLARKSEKETSVTKQREFLSTASLIETPVSVFKAREGRMGNCEKQTLGATDCQQRVNECLMGGTKIKGQETDILDLSCQASHTIIDDSRALSEESYHMEKSETHPNPISIPPHDNTVWPFNLYSDKDHLKEVDRVTDMNFSEAESEDSVVLPHMDCFSPMMPEPKAGSQGSPDISNQAFQSSVLPSQGFSPNLRISEDDCQSGGFSPRNFDDIMLTSSSPSVLHTAGGVEESMSNCTAFGKEDHAQASNRPHFDHTDMSQTSSINTACENDIDLAICDSEMTSADVHVMSNVRPSAGNEAEKLVASSVCSQYLTSEKNVESSNIVFGQQVSTNTDKSDMCHTDDRDSFPLRTLLPCDSPGIYIRDNELEVGRIENRICHLPSSELTISSHNNLLDTTTASVESDRNVNIIDDNLAKEFDSELLENNVGNSREVTDHKPCTSRETINSQTETSSQSVQSSVGLIQDRDTDLVCSTSSVCDEQPSYSTAEKQAKQEEKIACIWSEVKDPKSGRSIYVNSLTGNTMFENQWRECEYTEEEIAEQEICRSKSPAANPVPLCPSDREKLHDLLNCHLEGKTSDDHVKWRQPCTSAAHQTETGDSGTIEDLFSSWDNPVYDLPHQSCVNAEVSHPSRAAVQSYQTLYPTKFTKSMLRSVQVLGQVDNKFIACVLNTSDMNMTQPPDLIVLFDQHAAHERVRLEQLTEDIYHDTDDCCIKQSQVSPPKTLTFTEEEVRLIKSFRDEFKRIGIVFTINGSSRDSLNIHSIPACLVEREANEVKRGRESVAMDIAESLIKEHLEILRVTGGARNRLPQTIHKVLCSQACHGAVKFGDGLSLSQCQDLLDSLTLCDLPFQCAHGRPSVMPLLGLEQLKTKLPPQRIRRPNLWKISKNLPIHQ